MRDRTEREQVKSLDRLARLLRGGYYQDEIPSILGVVTNILLGPSPMNVKVGAIIVAGAISGDRQVVVRAVDEALVDEVSARDRTVLLRVAEVVFRGTKSNEVERTTVTGRVGDGGADLESGPARGGP